MALGQSLQSSPSVDLLLGQSVTDIPEHTLSFVKTMTGMLKNVAAGKLAPAQVLDQFNKQVLEQRRFGLTPIKGDTTDILRNTAYIKTLIRAEGRSGIPSERIMLVVFSQGGCQALSCAPQMQIPHTLHIHTQLIRDPAHSERTVCRVRTEMCVSRSFVLPRRTTNGST